DLDGIHGAAATLHPGARGVDALGVEPGHADGATVVAGCRATHAHGGGEPLEVDGGADGKIGTRAARQLRGATDVDGYGAVLHGGIEAIALPLDDAVARVDVGDLADLDVARLGFGDADFGLEAQWIGDASEIAAGLNLGAHFNREDLQDAVHAGAHGERIE